MPHSFHSQKLRKYLMCLTRMAVEQYLLMSWGKSSKLLTRIHQTRSYRSSSTKSMQMVSPSHIFRNTSKKWLLYSFVRKIFVLHMSYNIYNGSLQVMAWSSLMNSLTFSKSCHHHQMQSTMKTSKRLLTCLMRYDISSSIIFQMFTCGLLCLDPF